MAVINPTHAFNLPGPYQAELSRIADQQRMAEMLQAQSQAPLERYSYKGIEARTPATAGLAKLLQGLSGAYFQNQARDEEKALGERYKTESSDILRKAFEAGAGTPAVAGRDIPESSFVPSGSDLTDLVPPTRVPEGQPGEGNIVQPAYTIPGRAAVAPNQQEMARLLMTSPNPAHEAFGLQQMQKNAQMQAFINAGNAGNAPTPSAAPVATTSVIPPVGGAPAGQPLATAMSKFGGHAGGQPMSVWMQLDPSGAKYTEQLAKDFTEQNKQTDKIRELIAAGIKPGSAQWNAALSALATQGGIGRIDEKGNYSLLPGYAEGQGAVTKATEESKAKYDFIDVQITRPDGTTVTQKMTKAKAAEMMGGNLPPLNLTAPTTQLGQNLGEQLDAKGQPFNIRVPAPGAAVAPAVAPSGFGVSDPVAQAVRQKALEQSNEKITDKIVASFELAKNAETRIETINDLKSVIDLPAFSGPGASTKLTIGQLANTFYGVNNSEVLVNTTLKMRGLADLALTAAALIKGQGSITGPERELLAKAKAAPENLTVPEYKAIFKVLEKQETKNIKDHAELQKRGKKIGLPNMEFYDVTVPTTQLQGLSQETLEAIKRARGEKP